MRYWTAAMERADALLFGRVTYEMMESAWRQPATGTWPDWMGEWEIPFAETIDRAQKYVVSSTLSGSIGMPSWSGDFGQTVQRLKQEPGEGLFVGGVAPIGVGGSGADRRVRVPRAAGSGGPWADVARRLRERIQLELVDRHEFDRGRSPAIPAHSLWLEVIVPRHVGRPLRGDPIDGTGAAGWGTECALRRCRCPETRLIPVAYAGDYPGHPTMGATWLTRRQRQLLRTRTPCGATAAHGRQCRR